MIRVQLITQSGATAVFRYRRITAVRVQMVRDVGLGPGATQRGLMFNAQVFNGATFN